MTLELRDIAENFICSMGNDAETLAHFGPQEGYTIHVPNPLTHLVFIGS